MLQTSTRDGRDSAVEINQLHCVSFVSPGCFFVSFSILHLELFDQTQIGNFGVCLSTRIFENIITESVAWWLGRPALNRVVAGSRPSIYILTFAYIFSDSDRLGWLPGRHCKKPIRAPAGPPVCMRPTTAALHVFGMSYPEH